MHEENVFFQQKLLEKAYFILKLTGRAMVRPASSDFWKAPLVLGHHMLYPTSSEKRLLFGGTKGLKSSFN